MEREEPKQKQLKTITTEIYLDALWTYILGLAKAGVEEFQTSPVQLRPRMTVMRLRTDSLGCDDGLSLQGEAIRCNSLEGPSDRHLEGDRRREEMMWT